MSQFSNNQKGCIVCCVYLSKVCERLNLQMSLPSTKYATHEFEDLHSVSEEKKKTTQTLCECESVCVRVCL